MTHTLVQEYQKKYQKKSIPEIRSGMTVKITQKFLEGSKERQQVFQGVVIKTHEKTSLQATFTVRKIVDGIGVEKIFPIHSDMIEIEVVKFGKVRKAQLHYLRERAGKSARLKDKNKQFAELVVLPEDKKAVSMKKEEAVIEAPIEEAKTETAAE